jgi:hypothetical protein
MESLRGNYSKRLEDTVLDFQEKETQIQRGNVAEAHYNKTASLDYMAEQEFSKDTALRNMRYDQDRQNEGMTRNFALTLEKQRREYESIISALRDDASAKLAALRQETDFSSKMAHRSFAQKQNEIVRVYDKKLTDQKIHYEGLVEHSRSEALKAVRESERKTRQALDEQARSYDMRMAQSEVQWKERERHMEQNFEDTMERLKRSNALLISKKS